MKQFLASILALTTLFAPAACGGQNGSSGSEAEKDVESADTSSSEEGGAFVYWLNFKPELDETARKLAKKIYRYNRRPRPGRHRRLRHLNSTVEPGALSTDGLVSALNQYCSNQSDENWAAVRPRSWTAGLFSTRPSTAERPIAHHRGRYLGSLGFLLCSGAFPSLPRFSAIFDISRLKRSVA